jgi:hypothetical protein
MSAFANRSVQICAPVGNGGRTYVGGGGGGTVVVVGTVPLFPMLPLFPLTAGGVGLASPPAGVALAGGGALVGFGVVVLPLAAGGVALDDGVLLLM